MTHQGMRLLLGNNKKILPKGDQRRIQGEFSRKIFRRFSDS